MSWIFILVIAVILLVSVLLTVIYLRLPERINCNFDGKHVFITGGSKGIGKAVAAESLKRGCSCVTIVARNLNALTQAAEELATICQNNQFVQYFQIDVSKSYKDIEAIIRTAESGAASVCEGNGSIDILINNAGTVIQGEFDDLDINAFESQIRTNYLSLVYTTRAVIRRMKEQRSGHIAFVSSAAGQCSLWGYSAYSPSKFAIRGFADALHMELLPFNVGVTILYPPNTNTEGFQEELKTMTDEIRSISDAAGLFSPSQVASALVQSMTEGKFAVSVGLEGWMLKTLSAGAAPEPNFSSAIAQNCKPLSLAIFQLYPILHINPLYNEILSSKAKFNLLPQQNNLAYHKIEKRYEANDFEADNNIYMDLLKNGQLINFLRQQPNTNFLTTNFLAGNPKSSEVLENWKTLVDAEADRPKMSMFLKAFFSPSLRRRTRGGNDNDQINKRIHGFQRTGGMILLG